MSNPITFIPDNLVCSDGPYVPMGPRADEHARQPSVVVWESRRDERDVRPTFAEALHAYCMARHLSVMRLCKIAGVPRSSIYEACRCEHSVTTYYRSRLATLIDMQPESIRWPITVTRNEAHNA